MFILKTLFVNKSISTCYIYTPTMKKTTHIIYRSVPTNDNWKLEIDNLPVYKYKVNTFVEF